MVLYTLQREVTTNQTIHFTLSPCQKYLSSANTDGSCLGPRQTGLQRDGRAGALGRVNAAYIMLLSAFLSAPETFDSATVTNETKSNVELSDVDCLNDDDEALNNPEQ